ncbi:3-hydroxy-3-isohexenylglutaryl-CoA/hydroxy-methylglutaryl-CoA lyase [Cellvibrio zantedeschiae]|uniref:3-hydroxy-3-isohexenylglutaryl-CoA/hydroxy-methylglutaryl-CoA lyase n=1 Tax=Cellvibrio zantedeschiae TaxID=1237077 RepID=A0ABQ3B5X2_9GAMM|nr:hydroxymethylglutaryl-CoA lyase [Cellvibrio zantedeschiae]GGY80662.1 3-hydroxy-3-isohexenylglutaryl-CoA/hydroxy-methylglutaryl-CoA lyase [Cellvibrio zantedeschiae]
MNLPRKVRIVEVGPRDGLQNEKQAIPTTTKIQLIEMLVDAGLTYIEAGSFVNPKWVPQMADSAEVFSGIKRKVGVTYAALVPNLQGYERAINVDANEVAIFAAASEAFSQKNINCSIDESIKRFETLIAAAKAQKIPVRGYISCVAGCPYSGDVNPNTVSAIARDLLAMGCYEISLGDTIGVGTARQIKTLIEAVAKEIPTEKIAVHMHDTYGQALTNIYASLEMGVNVVDSSIAGLGGCPYAAGASGNVATEDLVYLLNGLKIEHGVDLNKLIQAGNFISSALNKPNQSKAAQAFKNKSL